MHEALLILAAVTVGLEWGYRPLPDGGLEYIIQIEPNVLDDMHEGQELASDVPGSLRDVRQCRVTIGAQKLPRGGQAALKNRPYQPAGGVQVNPQVMSDGGKEYLVELDAAAIAAMRRDMDLVYNVRDPRRFRIRQQATVTTALPKTDSGAAGARNEPPRDEGQPAEEPPPAIAAPAKQADMPPLYDPFGPPKATPSPKKAGQTNAPSKPHATPPPESTPAPKDPWELPEEPTGQKRSPRTFQTPPADGAPRELKRGPERQAQINEPPREEQPPLRAPVGADGAFDAFPSPRPSGGAKQPEATELPPLNLDPARGTPKQTEKPTAKRTPQAEPSVDDPFSAPQTPLDRKPAKPATPAHETSAPSFEGPAEALPPIPQKKTALDPPATPATPAVDPFSAVDPFPAMPGPFRPAPGEATKLTSFQAGPQGLQNQAQGEGSDPAAQAAAAASDDAAKAKKSWWALTIALMVLFASLGGNMYLTWLNWGLRRQYAALLEMFQHQREAKRRK
jgi:hypothetical protein